MNAATVSSSSTPSTASAGQIFGAALTGGAIAAVANLVVYFVGHAAGVEFTGKFDPNQPAMGLMVPMVAVASLVPSVVAALLALGLRKITQKAATVFAAVAALFALLSLGGPFSVAEASMGTKLALSLMHLVAGASIGGMLYRALRRQA